MVIVDGFGGGGGGINGFVMLFVCILFWIFCLSVVFFFCLLLVCELCRENDSFS